jgi:hypothetical protein
MIVHNSYHLTGCIQAAIEAIPVALKSYWGLRVSPTFSSQRDHKLGPTVNLMARSDFYNA